MAAVDATEVVAVEDDEEGQTEGRCDICDGSGTWARYQGEGEMDEVPCDACDGTGNDEGEES